MDFLKIEFIYFPLTYRHAAYMTATVYVACALFYPHKCPKEMFSNKLLIMVYMLYRYLSNAATAGTLAYFSVKRNHRIFTI